MPDYATRRIEAGKWIERYLSSVKVSQISTIEYNIAKSFGLGSFYVKKQLSLLQDVGIVKLNQKEGMIHWIAPDVKTPQEVKEEAEVEFFLKEQQHTPADREEPIPPIPQVREEKDAANP